MQTIGVYMPRWLYRSDPSDRLFYDELLQTINASGRYQALAIDLPNLRLPSAEAARAWCGDQNLALIIQHHSKFYSTDPHYAVNVDLLEPYVPFINSSATHAIGHDKVATKCILRERGIPVLPDGVLSAPQELADLTKDEGLYVIKPTDRGAGAGVRLIQKRGASLYEHHSGTWTVTSVTSKVLPSGVSGIFIRRRMLLWQSLLIGAFVVGAAVLAFQGLALLLVSALLSLFACAIFIHGYDRGYCYTPLLIEPYFNDSNTEFTSLRCTIIDGAVVEAVKRTNRRNITSNISSGGTASVVELSEAQKTMACGAANAIGADYAGVDLLVRAGETVIGEVNIGPFTLFGTYTGVHVGKLLGEYAIRKCDALKT